MSTPTTSPAPVSPERNSFTWSGGMIRWWKNINDWIKLLSPSGATKYDTGWVTLATGLLYRRYGKVVEVRFARNETYQPGQILLEEDIIPDEARPTGTNRRGVAYLGPITADGHLYVAPSGSLWLFVPTGTIAILAQGTVIYTVD